MTLLEINKKLIGKIMPTGESDIDREKLINIGRQGNLIESLLVDMKIASTYKNRQEYSIRLIGEKADTWLKDFRELLIEEK